MRIRLIGIKGFGKFIEKIIEPSEGFNLIFGPNESGKSTLADFVTAMLYGLGRRTRKTASAKNYKPWSGGQFAGVLEYVLDDGSLYRVDRNFDKGLVHIRDGMAMDITARFPTSRETGPRFAEEHLGLPEDVFLKSARIRQLQTAMDPEGARMVMDKLANLSTAGSEDLSLNRALQALDAALLEKVGTGRSTTRPLDRVLARLEELEGIRSEMLRQHERYLDAWAMLREEEERLHELKRKYDELQTRQKARMKRRLTELSEECRQLEKALAEAAVALKEAERKLAESEAYGEITEGAMETLNNAWYEYQQADEQLKECCVDIENLENERDALSRRLSELQPVREKVERADRILLEQELKAAENGARDRSQKPAITALVPAVCIVAAVFFAVLPLLVPGIGMLTVASASVFALAGVLTALARRKHMKVSPADMQLELLRKEGFAGLADFLSQKEEIRKIESDLESCVRRLEEAEEIRARLSEKKKAASRILSMYLERLGPVPDDPEAVARMMEAFRNGLRLFREHDGTARELRRRIEALVEKKKLVLREASSIAKREIVSADGVDAAAAGLLSEGIDVDSLEGVPDHLVRQAEDQIKSCEIRIGALKARLENAPSQDDLADVEDEIRRLLEEKRRLELAGRSIRTAREILQEVGSRLQTSYTIQLNEEMGRFISMITNGRYRSVKTDPEGQVYLEVPECEELMPVGRLSSGTIDQVYFSMRLATIALMEKGRETIPLFLDEPFLQYDEERTVQAFRLLKEASEGRQVFFMTSKRREVELARQVWGNAIRVIEL